MADTTKKKCVIIVDENLCMGCGNCVDICPNEALEMVDGLSTWAHPEVCEACGVCEAVCEHGAITLDDSQ